MNDKKLAPRSLKILRSLVENYIRDGQPVGSSTLARDSQLMVSSATIRHIMADLEKMGYLQSPHTSSGRIPTSLGYRLFVDHFISVQKPVDVDIQKIKQQLDSDQGATELVQKASSLLSGITHLTGIVTVPRRERLTLRQVEFLPLSHSRVLVILIFNDREVENRVIHTKRNFTRSELEQAGNFLTEKLYGKDLFLIRQNLLIELRQYQSNIDEMLGSVISVAEEMQLSDKTSDFVIDGRDNLFGEKMGENVDDLKSLFHAFNQKNDVLHLLDQCMQAQGLQIFIGEETGHQAFDCCSVVAAPYCKDGRVVGVLGVIGPQRMRYDKVVSIVDITAKLLSNAFDFPNEEVLNNS